MSVPPPNNDETADEVNQPDRGKRILAIVVSLFVIWLLVEMFAITLLGTTANKTFKEMGPTRPTGR